MSCGSPHPAGCLGQNLTRSLLAASPAPHRKPLAYHRASIPHAFLNQEKALKRVRKSLTSPGLFCWGCFSIRGKPWASVYERQEPL